VHGVVVLGEAGHLAAAIERHAELLDPSGEDALDVVLPKREPVVVPSREVADVEEDHREAGDLHHLALREEAVRDSTLVEHLDRACVQTTRARARELLVRTPLDDRYVDARERELGRQHEAGRSAAGDHYLMVCHGDEP
jgi:hypothetical protein